MNMVLSTLLPLLTPRWIGTVAGWAILYQLFICCFSLTIPQFLLVCCLVPPALFSTAPVCKLGSVIAAWWARLTVMEVSVFGLALYRTAFAGPWRLRRKSRVIQHLPGLDVTRTPKVKEVLL